MTIEKFSGSFFMNLTGPGTEPLAFQSDAVPPALRSLALFVYEYIMCAYMCFCERKILLASNFIDSSQGAG